MKSTSVIFIVCLMNYFSLINIFADNSDNIKNIIIITITENSAIIKWETDESEVNELIAWDKKHKLIKKKDQFAVKLHSIKLNNLEPSTRYHFVVVGNKNRSNLFSFETMRLPDKKPDFIMAIVADPQFDGAESIGGKNFNKVIREINNT